MQLRIFHDNLYIEETFEQIMELPITVANNTCNMATFLTWKKYNPDCCLTRSLQDHLKLHKFI